MQSETEVLSMDEAIERLRTTRPTFYRWLRAGQIKGHKVGRQWRFYAEDIERFLQGDAPRIDLPVGVGPLLAELAMCLQAHLPEGTAVPEVPESAEGLWERLLLLAVTLQAEYLHIESLYASPGEPQAVFRCRMDGHLQVITVFDRRLLSPLLEAVRVQAQIGPLAEQSLQTAQISFKSPLDAQFAYEVRMQFLNTQSGPTLQAQVVRAHEQEAMSLEHIALPESALSNLREVLQQGWGLVVASGPSGSGKSTTLYAAMNAVAGPACKSFYVHGGQGLNLPWVNTVAADGQPTEVLKGLLEADLDVLLLSESSDQESLQMLLRMALNGHLIMTSLHAPDAVSALLKLKELSDNPYTVSEALHLLLNHRLVRKLCEHCRVQVPLSEDLRTRLAALLKPLHVSVPTGLVWQASGCSQCQNGYRGRVQLTETLVLSARLRRALFEDADEETIRALWLAEGGQSWIADGLQRAAQGITSLAEVLRVAA